VPTLNRWFEQDQKKAVFRAVYVREAHPTDGWQVQANRRDSVLVANHTSMKDRQAAAQKLKDDLGLKIPILVDGMDDAIEKAYSGWPDRIYIVHKGKIAYKGDPGPRGFRPEEAMGVLARLSP
jgi:hypothetical protein